MHVCACVCVPETRTPKSQEDSVKPLGQAATFMFSYDPALGKHKPINRASTEPVASGLSQEHFQSEGEFGGSLWLSTKPIEDKDPQN